MVNLGNYFRVMANVKLACAPKAEVSSVSEGLKWHQTLNPKP